MIVVVAVKLNRKKKIGASIGFKFNRKTSTNRFHYLPFPDVSKVLQKQPFEFLFWYFGKKLMLGAKEFLLEFNKNDRTNYRNRKPPLQLTCATHCFEVYCLFMETNALCPKPETLAIWGCPLQKIDGFMWVRRGCLMLPHCIFTEHLYLKFY